MTRDRAVLAVVLVSVFIMPIGISGTAIALPDIGRDLGTSPTPLQWVINGFNASFALFTVVWGIFADRFGYRRTFVLGAVIFLAASALSVAAQNLVVLDAARALAGAGGAGVVAGGAAILSNAFSGTARTRAFAAFGTMIGLGLALGPTIAGVLVGLADWRAVYVATGIIMAIGLLGSPALPVVSVPKQKVFDFALLRNRRFVGFSLVPVAAAVGFVTMLSYLPAALGAMYGLSASASGLFMLPMTVPVFVGPMLASWLIRTVPRATPVAMMEIALGALFLGDLGLLLLTPGRSEFIAVVPMILLGLGFGIPVGLVDGLAIGSVEANRSGTAAGVLNFLRMGSEALAVGVYGAVLVALLGARLPTSISLQVAAGASGHATAYASSLHEVLIVMAVVVGVVSVVVRQLLRVRAAQNSVAAEHLESAALECMVP
jgi:predicted MFS family arabinose efflux permease